MHELRCPGNKVHGTYEKATGVLEVKCGSRWCGAARGVIVLHQFDLESGALLSTKTYKDPEGKPR